MNYDNVIVCPSEKKEQIGIFRSGAILRLIDNRSSIVTYSLYIKCWFIQITNK